MDKNIWQWTMLKFIKRNQEKHGTIIIGIGHMPRSKEHHH
jgi:hypothetical protein